MKILTKATKSGSDSDKDFVSFFANIKFWKLFFRNMNFWNPFFRDRHRIWKKLLLLLLEKFKIHYFFTFSLVVF